MTTEGWIVMLLSVGTVSSLFLWCIRKVLTTPSEVEKVHGMELRTPDMNEE